MNMKSIRAILWIMVPIIVLGCSQNKIQQTQQEKHLDTPFIQDYCVKYNLNEEGVDLKNVRADRNGVIEVLSSGGLMRPWNGQLLYPGSLEKDAFYRPMADKNLTALDTYDDQFVYLDDKAVLSNAWAGKLYLKHGLSGAGLLVSGKEMDFLISDGKQIKYLTNSGSVWEDNTVDDDIQALKYDPENNRFWARGKNTIYSINIPKQTIEAFYATENLTCFEVSEDKMYIGTHNGYLELNVKTKQPNGDMHQNLPNNDITTIKNIDGEWWFGSISGAFKQRRDGKFDYYASARWLPDDHVIDIAKGNDNMVLVLTEKGLAAIHFDTMTLYQKAMYFEQQVRKRHIRHGFNATLGNMQHGDLSTGTLKDSDNDGLWTSMYLAGQVFRYAATHSPEALQNCRESLDAMERLYTINPIPGFPSRSFERHGYKDNDTPWRRAEDPEWDWKSTTSSDEAIGHIFAFGAMAELIDDQAMKAKAISLIDTLMGNILDHDMYMIDWNGKPTQWGRWNPDYVNARPKMVGDRKINSSNIMSMLQTAYHFTHKEKYKKKAFELMNKYGYLENLMRPMSQIGQAPDDADALSKDLSEGWNHSDDEMYFVGYWGLYRYAFNDTLKEMYKKAIIDHWQAERPEKEGAWNIFTALTGVSKFDFPEAIWYLQEYPLDLIHWTMTNSHREDIQFIEPNFRGQTIKEVLPPDESPISRHNGNLFDLDGGDGGRSEYSAGDIWLLPYWMGRYLGVISGPEEL